MVFEKNSLVDSIIIVAHSQKLDDIKKLVKKFRFKKVADVIAGGETRSDSVSRGLKALDKDTEIVLIHDGARPLVTTKTIDEAINCCHNEQAVVTAVPVKPTIKRVDSKKLIVKETLNREDLWEVQTPQVFKKDILLRAHEEGRGTNPTDDAALVEQLGVKVKILMGDYKNIKVTTKEDLIVAEAFLNLIND